MKKTSKPKVPHYDQGQFNLFQSMRISNALYKQGVFKQRIIIAFQIILLIFQVILLIFLLSAGSNKNEENYTESVGINTVDCTKLYLIPTEKKSRFKSSMFNPQLIS